MLRQEIKKAWESLALWEKAGRAEEARKEKAAIKILEAYLPKGLSQDEITKMALEVIKELKAEGRQDMGRVMGVLMSRLAGRAEGQLVNAIVSELLP